MIILASSSPRRIELLKSLNVDFQIVKPTFNESLISKNKKHYALLEAKNKLFSIKNPANLKDFIISSDTIVVYKNKIYGKPKDLNEAFSYLKTLTGRTHKVITGVVIYYKNKLYLKEIKSKVKFNKLSDNEINTYLKEVNVLDKAGAYAVQDKSSISLIKKIKGSYTNVMGFPLEYIKEMLKEFNFL